MGNFEAIDDSSDKVASSLRHVDDHKGPCRTEVWHMIRATEIAYVTLLLDGVKRRKNSRILPS